MGDTARWAVHPPQLEWHTPPACIVLKGLVSLLEGTQCTSRRLTARGQRCRSACSEGDGGQGSCQASGETHFSRCLEHHQQKVDWVAGRLRYVMHPPKVHRRTLRSFLIHLRLCLEGAA